MIDLHLHTYYSDGILSPKELIERAKLMGVDTIAITDHDGFEGIREGLKAGGEHGLKVIPGVELSTGIMEGHILKRNSGETDEIYMHMLGFGVDINNEPLQKAVSEIRKNRVNRNTAMLKALADLGYQLTKEELQIHPLQEYIGKPNIAIALKKKGYIGSVKEAFAAGQFLGHPSVKAIHRVKIDGKKAIELINGAGGKAVLAHPMKISYKNKNQKGDFYENLESLLIQLKSWGLSGMECYYNSSQLITETEKLLELAEKHNLLISAGTDFHGPLINPDIEIGKFPIPPLKSNLQHSIHL